MAMLRIVAGKGEASSQDTLALSMRLAGSARELGLKVMANRASRASGSPSRYLTLLDQGGRRWLIRVSNHRMPVDTNQPVPHLDLVSRDGAAGHDQATLFLHRVAMSAIAWFDPDDPERRAELKRLRKPRRRA